MSTFATEIPSFVRRRRWPRYQISVPIRVIITTPEKTRIIDGRGDAVNQGGMAITAGVELEVGDPFQLELTLPYCDCPIRVNAVVRDRSGYRYGIEFVPEWQQESKDIERLQLSLNLIALNYH